MYLVAKIALYLVAAFLFGFALAWFVWRSWARRQETEINWVWERRMGDLRRQHETSLAKWRREVEDQRQQVPTLETSLADRSDLIANLQADLATSQARVGELESQLHARDAALRPTGLRPEHLLSAAPSDGSADDLKRIRGVGPVLEKTLNRLGIYYFQQIASLSEDEVAWVTDQLKTFPGRIARDRWVEQAVALCASDDRARD